MWEQDSSNSEVLEPAVVPWRALERITLSFQRLVILDAYQQWTEIT